MYGLLEVLSLSALGLMAVTWLTLVALRPGKSLASVSHVQRARRARGLLYAPLWVPVLVLLGALLPGFVAEVTAVGDHCLQSATHHHHHLCPIHPPHLSTQYGLWIVSALTALSVLAISIRSASLHLNQWRLGKTLVGTSERSPLGEDVRLLDQREPIAVTIGFFRPVILLSVGLLSLVPETTLQIILAHERAHVQRRDTFWAHIDRQMLCLFPRSLRHTLQDELLLAREQACDVEVARLHGAAHVAQALTRIARHRFLNPSSGLSIQDSSLTRRVLYLLALPDDAASKTPPARPHQGLFLLALPLLAGAGPVHDLLEWLITLLVH